MLGAGLADQRKHWQTAKPVVYRVSYGQKNKANGCCASWTPAGHTAEESLGYTYVSTFYADVMTWCPASETANWFFGTSWAVAQARLPTTNYTGFFPVETVVRVNQSEVSGKIKHFWNGAGVTQLALPSVWSTEIRETKRNDHVGEIQAWQVSSRCKQQKTVTVLTGFNFFHVVSGHEVISMSLCEQTSAAPFPALNLPVTLLNVTSHLINWKKDDKYFNNIVILRSDTSLELKKRRIIRVKLSSSPWMQRSRDCTYRPRGTLDIKQP